MQENNNSGRGLSARERGILDTFAARELATVTAANLQEIASISRSAANLVLRRLAHKGWLRRIRRGIYSPVPLGSPSPRVSVGDPWQIAMALYAPGYISGWSAAEHWDLTEQIFNAVSVVTSVPQRTKRQEHGGFSFFVRSVDKSHIFGTKRIWHGSSQVLVADPSRLVIDVLTTPDLGGGSRHSIDIVRAYWKSEHADPTGLLEYAERLDKGAVFKRLGFTAEAFADVSREWTIRCQAGMSAGISRLDPRGPDRGRISTRWRLRINVPVEAE